MIRLRRGGGGGREEGGGVVMRGRRNEVAGKGTCGDDVLSLLLLLLLLMLPRQLPPTCANFDTSTGLASEDLFLLGSAGGNATKVRSRDGVCGSGGGGLLGLLFCVGGLDVRCGAALLLLKVLVRGSGRLVRAGGLLGILPVEAVLLDGWLKVVGDGVEAWERRGEATQTRREQGWETDRKVHFISTTVLHIIVIYKGRNRGCLRT